MGLDDTGRSAIDRPTVQIAPREAARLAMRLMSVAAEQGFELTAADGHGLVSETDDGDGLRGMLLIDPTFTLAGRAFVIRIVSAKERSALEVAIGFSLDGPGLWSCAISIDGGYDGPIPDVESGTAYDEERAMAHVSACISCLARLTQDVAEAEEDGPTYAIDEFVMRVCEEAGLAFEPARLNGDEFPATAPRALGDGFFVRLFFSPACDDKSGQSLFVFAIAPKGDCTDPFDKPGLHILFTHDGGPDGWQCDFHCAGYRGARPKVPMGHDNELEAMGIITRCIEFYAAIPAGAGDPN